MNQTSKNILLELFRASLEPSTAALAMIFRAKHHDHMNLIDELESTRLIMRRDDRYYVQLSALLEIEEADEVGELLSLCEEIFQFLRNYYLEKTGEKILLNTLAESIGISRSHIDSALSYMVQTFIFGGYTTKFHGEEDAYVMPAEQIIRTKFFKENIQRYSKSDDNVFFGEPAYKYSFNNHIVNAGSFIHEQRIHALKNLQSPEFDFSRLVRMCEEINSSYTHQNYIATSILLRTLLDHVPPLLGFKTFKEVASNYPGKSLKGSLLHLENGCRSISDANLHQTIRKRETLPTISQVNYSAEIDVLLGEIIRKLEEISSTA